MVRILSILSFLISFAACNSSNKDDPQLNSEQREISATLPVLVDILIAGLNESGDIVSSTEQGCEHALSQENPIKCTLVQSNGNSIVTSVPDEGGICRLQVSSQETYQFFLTQGNKRCAELLRSDTSRPTIIGKDSKNFDLGILSYDNPFGRLITQYDPEVVMDSDKDGIVDIYDQDADGNGINDLAEADCDQDLIPDDWDCDDDGDYRLDIDFDEVNNVDGDVDNCS